MLISLGQKVKVQSSRQYGVGGYACNISFSQPDGWRDANFPGSEGQSAELKAVLGCQREPLFVFPLRYLEENESLPLHSRLLSTL